MRNDVTRVAFKSWILGGIAGFATSLMSFVLILLFSVDDVLSLFEFLFVFLGTPAIVGFMLAKLFSLKKLMLVPVCYLTFLVPVLGPLFGGPDPDLMFVSTLALLGAVGGLFWSLPFVAWTYIRKRSIS